MAQDFLGNPVTAAEAATLAAIDDFTGGFLAYETRAERIIKAADVDRGCGIANVYAGYLWMLLEAPDAPRRAAPYLDAAERALKSGTPRERKNLAVLRAWMQDDLPAAERLADELTDEFPRDLSVVKLAQYFHFNRGDFPAMLRVILKVLEFNSDIGHAYGMAAFAYEQCQILDEAETAAYRALELERREPWAQHALAHVMLTRGSIDEGARFLESAAPGWEGLNSFMLTHLWWHLAIFYLSQGRNARALELYDGQCWGIAKDYSQDQIGAVSLLAQMELAEIDVGRRWQELAEYLIVRANDAVLPFLTLQYLYGLARAGRPEADLALAAVSEAARCAPARARETWREVALPAARGLYAHARGDHETAWRELARAMPRLIEVGGSHAQRDLFDQVLLDAARKSGRTPAAQQMLELRRARDPDGVPVNAALAAVYADLGLPSLAARAQSRAATTRARHSR